MFSYIVRREPCTRSLLNFLSFLTARTRYNLTSFNVKITNVLGITSIRNRFKNGDNRILASAPKHRGGGGGGGEEGRTDIFLKES
jgi:hypothetical protein